MRVSLPLPHGVQEYLGDINSGSNVVVNQEAVGNFAQSRGGSEAVSGTRLSWYFISGGSDVDVNAVATNNTAIAATSSADSYRFSGAVSGSRVQGYYVVDSTVSVNAVTQNNTAISAGTAVAGTDVSIYGIQNSEVNVNASSTNNVAESVNGAAIAGNRIKLEQSSYSAQLNFNLQADNNQAFSQNGDAIVDNDIDVADSIVQVNTTGNSP